MEEITEKQSQAEIQDFWLIVPQKEHVVKHAAC